MFVIAEGVQVGLIPNADNAVRLVFLLQGGQEWEGVPVVIWEVQIADDQDPMIQQLFWHPRCISALTQTRQASYSKFMPRLTTTKDMLKLKGTNTTLQRIVTRALWLSSVDFIIVQGLRSDAEEWRLVKEGKSKTLDSRHITGHAVDLAAKVNGEITWELKWYGHVAAAMAAAALELSQPVRWGGTWKELPANTSPDDLYKAMKSRPKGSFVDAGHFEIPRGK